MSAAFEGLSCPCCFRPGALCDDFNPADGPAKLAGLRNLMKERNLGGYLVPSGDAHVSEYVSAADKRREWLTGFTGSAGTALITSDEALLWTDGRYFVQAAAQLKGSPWTLMKQNEPGVPDLEVWVQARQAKLRDTYGLKMRVGVDPRLISLSRADEWEAKGCMPLTYVSQNLLDLVWGSKQPAVARNPVVPHPLVYSGESAAQKIRRVGQAVAEAGGTALILNALDQICWLHNLRGSDIECNPVFLAYAILRLGTATPVPPEAGTRPPAEQLACFPCTPEGALSCGECNDAAVEYTVTLYVRCLDAPVDHLQVAQIRSHLAKEGCLPEERVVVELRPYASFGADEAAATAGAVGPPAGSAEPVVLLERMSCTPAMAASLAPAARKLVGCSPAEKFKACKNEAEIRGLVSAGRKDAAAIVSFLSWVTEAVQAGRSLTEAEAADEIGRRRSRMEGYVGDSFETISSTGKNAAIIHYQASHEECAVLEREAVYLCDTGGQYRDGTTDVTRTLHFGSPSEDERRAYTRVLQGHIALAEATFPAGTPGLMLEMLARGPLWKDGLNYLHGTGHGIGAYLNVHEGPVGVGGGAVHASKILDSPRMLSHYVGPIEKGHYLSDEPGFYREGAFGIRLESDLP